MPNEPVFSVSSVVEGQTFTVTVSSAACETVIVRFYVAGIMVDETDADILVAKELHCPADVQGEAWVVHVLCSGGPVASQDGVVG